MSQQGIGMTSQRTRERLIQRLMDQGISQFEVLEAIRSVPRHLFVDEALGEGGPAARLRGIVGGREACRPSTSVGRRAGETRSWRPPEQEVRSDAALTPLLLSWGPAGALR